MAPSSEEGWRSIRQALTDVPEMSGSRAIDRWRADVCRGRKMVFTSSDLARFLLGMNWVSSGWRCYLPAPDVFNIRVANLGRQAP